METTTQLLNQCYTGVVNDVMREMGETHYVLPRYLRPLTEGAVLAGPVFTIEGVIDTSIGEHESLVEWTGLLSKSKPGHIWISQPHDDSVAHMGELSAETLQSKGILGCVVDGAIRDVSFIRKIGLPVFHHLSTPSDVVGYWKPTGFDVPITIGEVLIRPGDYILADDDGVIRIPKEKAQHVAKAAFEATQVENKVRTAILEGMDAQEAYLTYGKF